MKREDYQKRIDALNPNVREAYEKYIEEDFQSLLNRTMEGYITPRFLRDALEYCEAVDRAHRRGDLPDGAFLPDLLTIARLRESGKL